MSGRVGIVTSSEIAVVGRDNRILLAFLYIFAIPLSDARTTGVGQDGATEFTQSLFGDVSF